MEFFMILLGIAGIVVNANGWFIVPSLAIKACFILGGFIVGFKLINIFRAQSMFKRRW